MRDVDALQAAAQQAEISGEMALTRSLLAKASLREQATKWSNTKARVLIASRAAGARRGVSSAGSGDGAARQ